MTPQKKVTYIISCFVKLSSCSKKITLDIVISIKVDVNNFVKDFEFSLPPVLYTIESFCDSFRSISIFNNDYI